jgi:hypothetical protein
MPQPDVKTTPAAELARHELEQAARRAESSRGRDVAIGLHLSLGQAFATLAVAEEIAQLREELGPRYEVRHVAERDHTASPAARVFVHGSEGLCMTYSADRHEHCARPAGHTGSHSWQPPTHADSLEPR